jgi:nicotinate-nucleotide pyrophosphorylase
MKFTTTEKNVKGATRIMATGGGKQRTVDIDPRYSVETNHVMAAGQVANLVLNAEQQAKIHHPSGRQRVRVEKVAPGKRVIHVNV